MPIVRIPSPVGLGVHIPIVGLLKNLVAEAGFEPAAFGV